MRAWLAMVIAATALAACERVSDDPLARNRVTCENANAEAAGREAACTALIDSGSWMKLRAPRRKRIVASRAGRLAK